MADSRSEKASNDTALRFYRDVLGLERLHYGIWNDGDELTFEALKEAQERYENFLLDSIPVGSGKVLDVGCGTGEMCVNLQKRGYDVEGLSPDRNQKRYFAEKLMVPFHHSKFEDFEPEAGKYDCIIMSESCQYIPMKRVFENAAVALKSSGHLMVCDYFVVDHGAGILSNSGHDRESFLKCAEDAGYKVIKHRDITKEAARTLDMGKQIADRILMAVDIFTERFREKHGVCYKFVKWLFRKKIAKMENQLPLLDSKRFSEVKRYEFFLFQKA
ncbi:Methyltransferase domain family [Verrucomicrobiia bacterium DG1235]|nr:Methyltransferase domain family [Verrucomicrobiae bacterium DG1235]